MCLFNSLLLLDGQFMTPHRAALKADPETQTQTLTPGERPIQLATLQITHTHQIVSSAARTHILFTRVSCIPYISYLAEQCTVPCEGSYLPSAPDWLSHWTQPAPPRPTAPGSRPQRGSSLCGVTAGNMFHKVVTKEM